MSENVTVQHNAGKRSFELKMDGEVARLNYDDRGGAMRLLHTEVPKALEGRGIAGKLAQAAFDEAKRRGQSIVPLCSFVAAYIQRHPEYLDLVDPAHREHLAH